MIGYCCIFDIYIMLTMIKLNVYKDDKSLNPRMRAHKLARFEERTFVLQTPYVFYDKSTERLRCSQSFSLVFTICREVKKLCIRVKLAYIININIYIIY